MWTETAFASISSVLATGAELGLLILGMPSSKPDLAMADSLEVSLSTERPFSVSPILSSRLEDPNCSVTRVRGTGSDSRPRYFDSSVVPMLAFVPASRVRDLTLSAASGDAKVSSLVGSSLGVASPLSLRCAGSLTPACTSQPRSTSPRRP